MNQIFGTSSKEEESEWLSVSDLMAGLMVIFLFIAIVFIRPLPKQDIENRENSRVFWENNLKIYEALVAEFEDDLHRWNAEIEEKTLLIRFNSPDVLFKEGNWTITTEFKGILKEFFPRYVGVIQDFRVSIEEVRIEGHTSSEWVGSTSEDEAYINNMELSQNRTRAVLKNVLNLSDVRDARAWLQPLLTANGLSSSRLVKKNGKEDPERSRRVEFRIRTKVPEGLYYFKR